jgi:nitroreductase
MEAWDALRARRNVREYGEETIPEEHLEQILEAARRTPSSMNQQGWDFVVVTDRDDLRELASAWRYAAHVGTAAAAIVLVIPAASDPEERETLWYDLGQATMSLAIAAADLGIGSGHASIGDQRVVRELLGLPEDREPAMLLALGYPADRPLTPIARPDRRPFDDVVHVERW